MIGGMDDEKHELERRWLAAGHAVQTGVKTDIELNGEDGAGASPKHLRTGVNMAMADHAALARLLVAKGVISDEEYRRAIAEGAEQEQERYEKMLSAQFGRKVTLG